jgi:hypothetical protein
LHHIVRNHKNAALEELLFSGIKVTGDRVRVSMDRGDWKRNKDQNKDKDKMGQDLCEEICQNQRANTE